uniref:Deoxyribonuclease II n=1 Tax=Soboliphyme baturini TaxID=241478 RepID=A0A183J8E5_9BILA
LTQRFNTSYQSTLFIVIIFLILTKYRFRFVLYKLPDINDHPNPLVQNGTAFLYLDASMTEWTNTQKSVSSPDNNLALTLQQYYSNRENKTVLYLLYNDQFNETSNKFGHTKGLLLFDENTGFWIVHSVPHFPNPIKYEWPSTATTYGQSVLCITFGIDSLEGITKQLFFNRPGIFSSNVPAKFVRKFSFLPMILVGEFPKAAPYSSTVYLKSLAGKEFVSFAKSKRWHNELYADQVAETLKSSLYVETWRNGPGNLPSSCEGKYNVLNIQTIKLPSEVEFLTNRDHSKWAVSKVGRSNNSKWVCIGDINRQARGQ